MEPRSGSSMKYTNKIFAIKALRDLTKREKPVLFIDEAGYCRIKLPNGYCLLGLKEAKDFVEDIMALGVKYYLEGELKKAQGIEPLKRGPWINSPVPDPYMGETGGTD